MGSSPGQVEPKTLKMVPVASLLGTKFSMTNWFILGYFVVVMFLDLSARRVLGCVRDGDLGEGLGRGREKVCCEVHMKEVKLISELEKQTESSAWERTAEDLWTDAALLNQNQAAPGSKVYYHHNSSFPPSLTLQFCSNRKKPKYENGNDDWMTYYESNNAATILKWKSELVIRIMVTICCCCLLLNVLVLSRLLFFHSAQHSASTLAVLPIEQFFLSTKPKNGSHLKNTMFMK